VSQYWVDYFPPSGEPHFPAAPHFPGPPHLPVDPHLPEPHGAAAEPHFALAAVSVPEVHPVVKVIIESANKALNITFFIVNPLGYIVLQPYVNVSKKSCL